MLRLSVLSLLLAAVLAAPAGAVTGTNFDERNGVTLDDAPYRAGTDLVASVTYDNSGFGASEEQSAPTTYAACGAKGAKSGWVRLNTAVDGRIFVDVTSTYDVFFAVYTAPNSIAPGSANLGQLSPVDCHNANTNKPNESYTFGYAIKAGSVVYVQTMSVCSQAQDATACTPNESAAAPGGPTTVNLRFDPDDGPDEDGVPNPLDVCPAVAGVVNGTPSNGCPDADGDGVTEPGDACPGVRGKDGTGCRRADEDGDGFVALARPGGTDCNDDDGAIRPNAEEVAGNPVDENCDGKLFVDKDDDDFDDAGADCRPADPAINPGAKEIPGNRVDEDCKGGAAAFTPLTNAITPLVLRSGSTWVGFASFVIADARPGLTVTVLCSGTNCPFGGRATFTSMVARKRYKVATAFQFRRPKVFRILPPGARVTVFLSSKGRVGKVVRYTIQRRGPARIQRYCTEAGSTALKKTCSGRS